MVKTEHVEAEASLDELMDECEGKGDASWPPRLNHDPCRSWWRATAAVG
jgi:hypothetical protein